MCVYAVGSVPTRVKRGAKYKRCDIYITRLGLLYISSKPCQFPLLTASVPATGLCLFAGFVRLV